MASIEFKKKVEISTVGQVSDDSGFNVSVVPACT